MDHPVTSRRTFLKVGAAAGLAAWGSGMLSGCASNQGALNIGTASAEEIEWDGVFDVVVVGFGAAGAAAAISAAESGASVLLADKAPEGSEGGNSRFSSQLFVSADDKQQACDYQRALSGSYYVPDDVLDAYADGLCAIRSTLVDWGLDESELLDVTDVTQADIAELARNHS